AADAAVRAAAVAAAAGHAGLSALWPAAAVRRAVPALVLHARATVRLMRVVGDVDPALVAQLAQAARATTLEEVLAWAHATGGVLVEVVVQVEYTHDVVVRGPAPAYLCFDST